MATRQIAAALTLVFGLVRSAGIVAQTPSSGAGTRAACPEGLSEAAFDCQGGAARWQW